MTPVECGDVGLAELAHGQRYFSWFVGADEQVHVVTHQHVGVNLQRVPRGAFAQQTEIVAAIVVIQKDGVSIDAALRDMESIKGTEIIKCG
jgi:hypothetical protein